MPRRGRRQSGGAASSSNSSGGGHKRSRNGRGAGKQRKQQQQYSDGDSDDNLPTRQKKNDELDDEEIDEDEAFNSEDEKMFGALMPSLSKRRGAGASDEDDFEEDGSGSDDDDDDGSDGGMLLSDMLEQNLAKSGSAPSSKPSSTRQSAKRKAVEPDSDSDNGDHSSGEEQASGSEEEEEESDESEDESDDEDDDDEERHAKLLAMVGVDSGASKSKASGEPRKAARRFKVKEASEPLAEAEYNLAPDSNTGGVSAAGLTLEDLMNPLANSAGFGTLKKQLAGLQKGPAPLSKPLARVQEERAMRQIQYASTSKEVSKWTGVVQANRQATHLAFGRETQRMPTMTSAAMASDHTPSTDLEKQVARLLSQSGYSGRRGAEQVEVDELEVAELTESEIKKRQGQLARLKALLFYDEQKRRRANKIKSKAFRRVRKRQAMKQQMKDRDELRKHDPEAAEKLDEAEALDAARSRVTLKHRNKSKWVKWALKHGGTREEANREDLNTHAGKVHELRVKMHRVTPSAAGAGSDDDSSSDESEQESGEAGGAKSKGPVAKYVKRAALLAQEAADDAADDDDNAEHRKGLFGLKFMQNAAQKSRDTARKETAALLEELQDLNDSTTAASGAAKDLEQGFGGAGEEVEEGEEEEEATPKHGRRSFAGAQAGRGRKGQRTSLVDAPTVASKADKAMQSALGRGRGGTMQVAAVQGSAGDRNRVEVAGFIDVAVDGAAATRSDPAEAASSAASNGNANAEQGGDNPWMQGLSRRAYTSGNRKGKRSAKGEDKEVLLDVGKTLAKLNTKKRARAASNASAASEGDAGSGTDSGGQASGGGGVTMSVNGGAGSESSEWATVASGQWRDQGGKPKPQKPTASALAKRQAASAEAKAKRRQEELVRRAFAGVGAEEEMEAEKAALEDADKPKEEAVKKGWGSWAGMGVVQPKPKPKPKPKAQAKAEAESPKSHAERRNAWMKHVIVNKKRDRKAAKYLASAVPFPFTSREQYERSLRLPLGRDWNTMDSVADLNLPLVTTKAGAIIEPIAGRRVAAGQQSIRGRVDPRVVDKGDDGADAKKNKKQSKSSKRSRNGSSTRKKQRRR